MTPIIMSNISFSIFETLELALLRFVRLVAETLVTSLNALIIA